MSQPEKTINIHIHIPDLPPMPTLKEFVGVGGQLVALYGAYYKALAAWQDVCGEALKSIPEIVERSLESTLAEPKQA